MIDRIVRAAAAFAAAALAFSACAFSPLNHHISIGEASFVIFVGEGIDHNTDLFAVDANGGSVSQVTFTPLVERDPQLSPHGEIVAFLRMRDTLPGTERDVVLMNLLGGGEQRITLPAGAGTPSVLAWSDSGTALYIRTDHGTWRSTVPPAKLVASPATAADLATADSALTLWLGTPRFARAVPCDSGLCIVGRNGDTTQLAVGAHDAMRWGNDSVAWFEGSSIVIRALGPGHARTISWTRGPGNPRQGSYAAAVSDSN